MSQRLLIAELSRSFVSIGTLRVMSQVAAKMAAARKAVAEIQSLEDILLAEGASTRNMKRAMSDTAALAKVASRSAAEAIVLLKGMKPDMEAYAKEAEAYASRLSRT